MEKYFLHPDKVRRYLADDFETLDLNAYYDPSDILDRPEPVVLRIPSEMTRSGIAFLFERGNPSFIRKYEWKSGEDAVVFYNLYPGRIYDVRFRSGEKTAESSFCTEAELPCTLYVDGIRNVRDFGGWTAKNGVLREGLLYRGSEMNLIDNHGIELTEEGKRTMLKTLAIRTDLDLRNEKESGFLTESPLGAQIRYFRKPVLGYMDFFRRAVQHTVREIFEILANRENYPIYVHCWAGADRTGTLIALLKAALGVSYEDITRDFELSAFSVFGLRGRCNRDFTYCEVFEHLKSVYSAPSLCDSAIRYLFEKVGIKENTLNAIRSILVG